jgi:hypothetical protein
MRDLRDALIFATLITGLYVCARLWILLIVAEN